MIIWRRIVSTAVVTGLCLAGFPFSPAAWSAQPDVAPCGYVDGFALPVPDIDIDRTDFAIYRARFGGLHTGIDVSFEQLGEPVRAAARGRVTYSDPAAWDTEKGVVVIQHTMPDGSLVNTLYGHMEELNGYYFPAVDQCVEAGDIIGAVGFPSRGRPHLHYEIRTRYRYEGGPGYTQVNPLELGWLHPLDFTFLARVWVLPAYRGHFSLLESATLPPLPLADGSYVIVHSGQLRGLLPDGTLAWEFDTLGSVTGLLALADGRVLATSSANQVLVLNQGTVSALWRLPRPVLTPPIALNGAVVFLTDEYALAAFTPDGQPLWQTASLGDRALRWAVSADRLAVATQDNTLWVVDSGGAVLHNALYDDPPLPFAAPGGGFTVLSGDTIWRLDAAFERTPVVETQRAFTTNADLLHGPAGMLYVYTGEGRSLYGYAPDGSLSWIAYMPGNYLRPPLLGVGGGRLVYALSMDGQLIAFDTTDGRLVGGTALYTGGVDGSASARWLNVRPDDTVTFYSGYLSVVTIAGLDLIPAGDSSSE